MDFQCIQLESIVGEKKQFSRKYRADNRRGDKNWQT